MSNGSSLRRQAKRLKPKATPEIPVTHVPGVVIPTCTPPLCKSHLKPMIYVACSCHPTEANWQCSEYPLRGHMKRVR